MVRQHPARWIASQSARTTGNRGHLTGRFPAPGAARSGDPGTVRAYVLLAIAGIAARQGTEPPGAAGFLRQFLAPVLSFKELALLAAEEKKLLEEQKNERDALKQRLAAVKKKIREEQRKLNERRPELLGHCMMQKFSSDPGAKEAMLQDLDGFLSKPEDRELFGLLPKQTSAREGS